MRSACITTDVNNIHLIHLLEAMLRLSRMAHSLAAMGSSTWIAMTLVGHELVGGDFADGHDFADGQARIATLTNGRE